jgi:signal transduction histidine kinase
MRTRSSIVTAFNDDVATAAAQLQRDQTAVNEALVQRIFQCQRVEAALRLSESKLHALLAHQLGNREDERRRIALEIHDTLGQNLLALRLDVAALHEQTGEGQPGHHTWTGAALANLDGTIHAIKRLITDLRPFQLELGLQAALDWSCNTFRRSSGIGCTVTGMAALRDVAIDETQLLTVYRVLEECLDNVVRHAQASAVHITVRIARKRLTMRVADNGIGIDPAQPPAPAFGLMGMRERLAETGGTLAIAPARPHGTVVTVRLPLFVQK